MIRFFDLFFSVLGLLILFPLLFLIYIIIVIESGLPGLFIQTRVGRSGYDFNLYKFRTMRRENKNKLLLTIGDKDNRITRIGKFLRKLKLDELPQLFNVLKGEMSLVGPRPEVRKYVDLYTEPQRVILYIKPGITDYASIMYRNENEILVKSDNPEKTYIEEIMPKKITLNMIYLNNYSLKEYFKIIFITFYRIFFPVKEIPN